MTAPAAPVIRGHLNGPRENTIRVLWRPVDTATDYNLYVADEDTAAGIEVQYDDTDLGTDGWFHYTFRPLGTFMDVYVTALNVGAEESDPSETFSFILT